MKRPLLLQIAAFVVVRTLLNTMMRMVYPFLPVFGRGLGVDLAALSLALTFRSATGALGPFLASVADSRGRKTGMLFGLLLFVLGTGLVAVWPVYPAFFLALILTILGVYAFNPSMHAFLGDRVPYRRRGLALALTEIGWSLSFIIGVPLVGVLIARGGWQAPFPFFAGLGVLAIAGLAWLLPRDLSPPSERLGLFSNLRLVFTYAPALAGLVMGGMMSAANEAVNVLFGLWMEDSFGLQIAALGAASILIGLSELGGESLAGGLTDRLGKPRSVGLGLVLNSLAALGLPVLGVSLAGALVGLFLFYITFEFTIVSCVPLMTEVLPPARATLMATFIGSLSLGRALTDLIAPSLYGWGILGSGLAAVAFNLLAFVALQYMLAAERRLAGATGAGRL